MIDDFPQIRRSHRQLPPGIRPNALRARTLPPARVVTDNPSGWIAWLLILVTVSAAIIGVALWFGTSDLKRERDAARGEAVFWRQMARGHESTATVRLERDGEHFKCSHFHIHHDWEAVVAAECAVLGELLMYANDAKAPR